VFWSLTAQLSEPNGHFVSRSGSTDNLPANEMRISTVAALPLQRSSIFIRPNRGGSSFSPMMAETAANRVQHLPKIR
jgi:hypothetical protein